ncbi:hypothetical protein Pcinc_041759, partial [Petrolisthes cinctipes]
PTSSPYFLLTLSPLPAHTSCSHSAHFQPIPPAHTQPTSSPYFLLTLSPLPTIPPYTPRFHW